MPLSDSGSLYELCADGITQVHWWFVLFLFAAFLIITSDFFAERLLARFDGAYEMNHVTNWGAIIQAGLFAGSAVAYQLFFDE